LQVNLIDEEMRKEEFGAQINERSPASAIPLNRMPVVSGQRKKIPIDLRKAKIRYDEEPGGCRRLMLRLRTDSQSIRSLVQLSFSLLCLWIGIEFILFVRWGQSPFNNVPVNRPPGVEGFLPISSLISLKYWMQTEILNGIHPSGLFIFLAIAATALLLKKSFCGWLCPIGTLSESLWMLGQKLFGKNLQLPGWLDYPLRSVKYLLLAFFAYAIGTLDVQSLSAFIYSPYNKVADVKMYLFFADISHFALWSMLFLIALSVLIRNFWCRYLCPYGSLLGILSVLSPVKITRSESTCIDCALCTKACPAGIEIHKKTRVWSDECTSCYRCVQACPVVNTLEMRTNLGRKAIPPWIFGLLVAGIFAAITGLAMLTGHWRNQISNAEYKHRIQNIEAPIYQHFRGRVPQYGPND
jgi:polyferredoxin